MQTYLTTAHLCLANAARAERGEDLTDSADVWRKRAARFFRKAAAA